ncbi:MAG: 50S ribosomal protein L9 [Eubacterium sp.]|nr:50S ribosomal protein L9 [Eubacterium sp.]
MKVILLVDDRKLGKKGQIVEVNDGYARNYVLPKKVGMEATPKNLNDWKLKKAHEDKVATEKLAEAKALAEELKDKKVTASLKVGANGNTFGSVSSKEVAELIKKQLGYEFDKKKIIMKDAAKGIGGYQVGIKLHPEVTAEIMLDVQEEK